MTSISRITCPGTWPATSSVSKFMQRTSSSTLSLTTLARRNSTPITANRFCDESELLPLVPENTRLLQNYPNPFNPDTWIPYELSEASEVNIIIYNIQGRIVKRTNLGYKDAGIYSNKDRAAYWNGRNETNEPVASGIYWVELSAGDYKKVRRMILHFLLQQPRNQFQ